MANVDIDVVRARNLLESIEDRLEDMGPDIEDRYVSMVLDDVWDKIRALRRVLEGKKHV